MGAGASVEAQAAAKMQTRSRIVTAFLNLATKPHHAPLVAAKTQWRIAAPYAGTGSEPSTNEEELLNMLHDPVGQKHIGAFAKKIMTAETFFCWVEVKEFKDAPSIGYRKSLAKLIYKKYIKNGSTMALGSITSELIATYDKKITDMETNPSLMTPEFFDPLMTNIVNDMCQNTFLRFKTTPEYDAYKKDVKDTYNKVTVEDFEYLELLGSGGFGRVVHARKKSTGKHYAIKIQLKAGLLDEHHDQLGQITSEKDILQVCHNPFILDMQYSFQTPAHAIIVTELVRGGDLGEALKASREGYIIEDRVRLYAAEIGLALNHMHELGLIYRDLKPGNVLLGEDGHVILADMGLAAGFDPTLLKKDENSSKYIPVNPKLTRRKTTVGTRGYMAPEIISGKLVKRDQRPGYTFAVDYWSLGVTIFELMCGYQPFSVYSGGNFFQEVANEEIFRLSPRTQHKIELQKMAQGVTFPAHISKCGQDFLKRLLDVNVEQRLGCNCEKGFAEFMEHPFFESIDWEKLMMKHIDPKFKPALPLLTDKKIYNSYEHMMSHFDMRDKDFIRHDWYADPPPEQQKHFESWDYISQSTLRAELGIAKELDETNIPYKVLQLTGEDTKGKQFRPVNQRT
uniref:Protein kinase domain-containing protein n=1 Tax=Globisporangium ultimum (strain ATCC 200006 / CBS 805.95 / DAOM BR144) TaxID=431595 RepID=K3X895_GLOUD